MRALGASRTSVATGGVLAGNWARDPLWKNARAVPSLDLRFAENKSLTDVKTGASLVTFTRASTATYVGSDGLVKSATTNEARFDHNPTTGESIGLLVEEARTNLATNSESLTLGFTQQNTTVTSDATAAPDGTTTADLSVPNTTSASHASFRTNITFAISTSYAISVFVKPSGYTNFQLSFTSGFNNTNAWANFILVGGGSLGFTGTSGTATIQALSNGWYRCSLVATSGASAASGGPALVVLDSDRNGRDPNYAGNNTSGIYLWGAQLEAGSFPTSYISTTSATVTRAADVASITGSNFSSWYNQTEGTVFTEYVIPALGVGTVTSFDDGTTNNRWQQRFTAVAHRHRMQSGGVSLIDQTGAGAPNVNTANKATYVLKSGNLFFAANGNSGVASAAAALPTVTQLQFATGPATDVLGRTLIRRLTYWPVRLANTTLQSITAP